MPQQLSPQNSAPSHGPQNSKTPVFLFLLGAFLLAFSFFVTHPVALAFITDSLRKGKELNEDIVFWLQDLRLRGALLGSTLCLMGVAAALWGDKIRAFLGSGKYSELASMEGKGSGASRAFDLFAISMLGLFAELLIIRWLAVEMRIFAYFKNVPLISCFLGLGLGCALGEERRRFNHYSFPFWFSIFAVVIVFLGPRLIFLNPAGADEYIWGVGKTASFATQALSMAFFLLIVIGVFIWNTRIFMTLGYVTGRMLNNFKPLTAYSINILGSLAGVWFFTTLSFFSTPPVVWFGATLALALVVIRNNKRQVAAALLVSAAFLSFLVLRHEQHQVFWSPYYKITLVPFQIQDKEGGEKVLGGYSLKVNEDSHQTGMNYSKEFVAQHGRLGDTADILELPYRVRPVGRALVVGAGMGNDVAAGLRAGAEHIDAVEIDPMILKIGGQFHPEKPYSSPRVTRVNDDARSYFKKTKKKYDLIVFGILDSHTQFSSLSSLRLDNYVYTVESIRDAKALLNPGGMISITFGGDAKNLWMGERFHRMLADVFGRKPIVLDLDRLMLINGEDLTREELVRNPKWQKFFPSREHTYEDTDLPQATDDWPYIYMRKRAVPNMYLIMIAVLSAVSWVIVRRNWTAQRGLNGHFFFLGAAFLLLETKAVTELALVFGTTWIVNSVVFSGIMILILLANFAVKAFRIQALNWVYLSLAATLVFSYFFDLSSLAALPFIAKVALSTFVVLLPIFFAAIIFAVSFSRAAHLPTAFGSNMIGCILGGFVEYASLATGVRFLAILALAFYLASWVAMSRSKAA